MTPDLTLACRRGHRPASPAWPALALAALLAWTGTPAAAASSAQPSAAQASPRAATAAKSTRQGMARKPAKARRAAPDTPPYGLREDVQAWMAALAAVEPALPLEWLQATVGQARHVPAVTRLIMPPPPGVPKNWAAYRDRFIEPRRVGAGVAFWDAHAQALARAEQRWGVPASLVVGIIGVETLYGQITGGFRAVDALATLAFDFPSGRSDRSGFFRDELVALLQLARRENLDLKTLQGSYAGALGWGQFMPSSWLRWGLDFDGDARAALTTSPVDAIGSVANFLAAHGWQAGQATRFAVTPPPDEVARARLLAPDIRPTWSAAELQAQGAVLEEAAQPHPGKLALIALQNGEEPPSYLAGTENFWVVTRYNWSAYYALAVLELGEAVAAERARRERPAADVPAPAATSAPAQAPAAPASSPG